MSAEGQAKIYQMITDRVISLLESGTAPWRKPWHDGSNGNPANMASGKAYRGINHFILNASGFGSRYWMSHKQIAEKGGKVVKGEKGTPVIFWKWLDVEDKDHPGKTKQVPLLRYYTVFNLDQTEGIDVPDAPLPVNPDFSPIETAVGIVEHMPKRPAITHTEPRAYFRPATDTVNMPKPETFDRAEEYYSTLFHELTHATGHESRLNRRPSDEIRHFGDTDYSKEELVAEMGAAYLCGMAGIEPATIENSAAYLQSWVKVLKGDAKLVIHAAAAAQKAADFILGEEVQPYAAKAPRQERKPRNAFERKHDGQATLF